MQKSTKLKLPKGKNYVQKNVANGPIVQWRDYVEGQKDQGPRYFATEPQLIGWKLNKRTTNNRLKFLTIVRAAGKHIQNNTKPWLSDAVILYANKLKIDSDLLLGGLNALYVGLRVGFQTISNAYTISQVQLFLYQCFEVSERLRTRLLTCQLTLLKARLSSDKQNRINDQL